VTQNPRSPYLTLRLLRVCKNIYSQKGRPVLHAGICAYDWGFAFRVYIEFLYINKYASTYMCQELHSSEINLVNSDVTQHYCNYTVPYWRISKSSRYSVSSPCSAVRLKRIQLIIKCISHCNAFLKQEERMIDIEPCV
jgi:hypothetical protein